MAQHRFRKAKGIFGYCECGWYAKSDADSMTDDELFINEHLGALAINAEPDVDPVVCQIVYLAQDGTHLPCIKEYGHDGYGDAERDGGIRKHESASGRKWM